MFAHPHPFTHHLTIQTQLVLLNVVIEELQLVPGEVEFVGLYLLDILKQYQPTLVLIKSLTVRPTCVHNASTTWSPVF